MKKPRVEPIEGVRKIALALPDVFEKEAWGEPTFRAPGGMFAMFSNNHHNDGNIAILCKAPLGYQAEMVRIAPERFYVPPYVGVNGWVGLRLDVDVDWDEVAGVIEQAYKMCAEKSLPRRALRNRSVSAKRPR